MAKQPIIENGEIVDEYDDDPDATQEEGEVAEVVLPDAETVVSPEPEPMLATEAAAVPVAVPRPLPKEDFTDFTQSDVSIQIVLYREDGDPQGRLVSVIVHNFSPDLPPVIEEFREAQLTDKARLDSIQRAIYPVMQRFLHELAGRKQKKQEEEAKRAQRSTPRPAAPTSPSVAPPSASPPASPPAPTAAPQPTATPQKGQPAAAKDSGKKKQKYQPIPMF